MVPMFPSINLKETGINLHRIMDVKLRKHRKGNVYLTAHYSNGDNAKQVNFEIEQFVIQATVDKLIS